MSAYEGNKYYNVPSERLGGEPLVTVPDAIVKVQ